MRFSLFLSLALSDQSSTNFANVLKSCLVSKNRSGDSVAEWLLRRIGNLEILSSSPQLDLFQVVFGTTPHGLPPASCDSQPVNFVSKVEGL